MSLEDDEPKDEMEMPREPEPVLIEKDSEPTGKIDMGRV